MLCNNCSSLWTDGSGPCCGGCYAGWESVPCAQQVSCHYITVHNNLLFLDPVTHFPYIQHVCVCMCCPGYTILCLLFLKFYMCKAQCSPLSLRYCTIQMAAIIIIKKKSAVVMSVPPSIKMEDVACLLSSSFSCQRLGDCTCLKSLGKTVLNACF